ncbi:hypothetical protein [Streptomyces olivoreticuli]|uniref:hypothetical protein n=1 Tax=Streptomyces olivoreticuli TaxID=68246 RepID=UPI001F085806|nr:hypothetical protein [Streptomyces olivoreticuli]
MDVQVGREGADEARTLLGRARERVAAAAGAATITVGILADSSDRGATRLAAACHRRPSGVEVRVRETNLTDPTCDVALALGPFDETGPTVRELRVDAVGAVMRADDPPARRDRLEPAGQRCFWLPDGTAPVRRSSSRPPSTATERQRPTGGLRPAADGHHRHRDHLSARWPKAANLSAGGRPAPLLLAENTGLPTVQPPCGRSLPNTPVRLLPHRLQAHTEHSPTPAHQALLFKQPWPDVTLVTQVTKGK